MGARCSRVHGGDFTRAVAASSSAQSGAAPIAIVRNVLRSTFGIGRFYRAGRFAGRQLVTVSIAEPSEISPSG